MTTQIMENYRQLLKKTHAYLEERDEASKLRIQVGSATCENAAGAEDVFKEFQKHITASGRTDIVLRRTGCTGRCSCEPIVGISIPGEMPVKYQKVDRDSAHEIFANHVLGGNPQQDYMLETVEASLPRYEFLFCSSDRCCGTESTDLRNAFTESLKKQNITDDEAVVIQANCFGLCQTSESSSTFILVRPSKVIYKIESQADIDEIIESHIKKNTIVDRLKVEDRPISKRFFDMYGDVSFFNQQSRLALRNSGIIDPENIYEFMRYNGFEALANVLSDNDPDTLIDTITKSNLRGRGGGGYPTGLKWANSRKTEADQKYVICNADEGDPGAFMDRSMLEGDPFSIVEGMTIGAFAVGASYGFLYIRAEYPMAIERIDNAIKQAREHGLLGKNILGSGFDFDLEIRLGAGAFVCGEETALIHSIEGKRGQPRIRPPYPAISGLWDKPTVINNVETWANVPVVCYYGADWFSKIGTEKSGGTKVFALVGKINHTGLVEVPMGTSLREIVYDIGGGVPNGKKLKAVQTGGPAGGCLPADWIDTKIDFDTLQAAGSIMGSGGMIVMDEDDCMVDIAKYFLEFSQSESCGKCTPCREGTKRMLEILTKITDGKGTNEDIKNLERLAQLVKKTSLCGLGRAAPNPVLSTLKHFRDEYESHVNDKKCAALKCTALISYEINVDKCVGCTLCARNCPVNCITGQAKKTHTIDQASCIKCGRCFQVCRFKAVDKN